MRLDLLRLAPLALCVLFACEQGGSSPPAVQAAAVASAPPPATPAEEACNSSAGPSIKKDIGASSTATYAATGAATTCAGGTLYLRDLDADVYATADACCVTCAAGDAACTGAPSPWHGYVKATTIPDKTVDCDDSTATRHPNLTEIVNDGIDQDCISGDTCFADADNDGFRPNATATTISSDLDCADANEAIASDPTTDCDDTTAGRRPGLTEIVNDGIDQDCVGGDVCFADADDDGYRPNGTATVLSADLDCLDANEALSTDPTTDCDDTTAGRRPGLAEVVNDGIDQDCASGDACYKDADNDGYRPDSFSTVVSSDLDCADVAEAIGSDPLNDCDDNNASRNPGITEIVGDSLDQDCIAGDLCYQDDDNDGYRPDATSTTLSFDLDCADFGEAIPADPIGDCDDNDSSRSPGKTEIVDDGADQDCDNGDRCYVDADNDGFRPNPSATVASVDLDCIDPGEAVSSDPTTDCDDTTAGRHPGLTEIIGDGIDQDCSLTELCYLDADNDGYRPDANSTVPSADLDCDDSTEGIFTDPTTDCDDGDPARNPGNVEIRGDDIDQDCDLQLECPFDVDLDGFGSSTTFLTVDATLPGATCNTAGTSPNTSDCDDLDPGRYPGLAEIVDDGIDQDCAGGDVCYKDADDDGFRPDATSTVLSADVDCTDAFEARGFDPTTDCDDTTAGRRPGLAEIVGDGIDQDCVEGDACYRDADDDGHRPDATSTVVSLDLDCADIKEAVASDPTDDCDDNNAGRYPGLAEIVNDFIDQDCDLGDLCYMDADDDGYRPDATSTVASVNLSCTDPFEAVKTDPTTDCDDTNAGRHPGLFEIVGDGIDQDCLGGDACFKDADDDGHRPDATSTVVSVDNDCEDPFEAILTDPTDDCDDSNAGRYPGLAEIIDDHVDQDCIAGDLCYMDADDDGYRPDATSTTVSSDLDCADAKEAVAADPTTDCDDSTSGRHPGLAEIPANGIDEDCFGGDVCFVDLDDDGFRPGAGTATVLSADLFCTSPGEATATDPKGDCLDLDVKRYPGSMEFCSQQYTPERPCEACEPGEQIDDDCNGDVNSAGGLLGVLPPETGPGVRAAFADKDGDGYGSDALGAVLLVCEIPVGASTNDLDCNDTPIVGANIHPGVFEKCDNVDQNCNGTKDEAEAIDPANPGDAGCVVLYRDRDLDGTGDPTVSHCLCTDPRTPSQDYEPVSDTDVLDTDWFDQVQPPSPLRGTFAGEDYVAPATDCDDAHADIRPDDCHDGLDNDGDGWVDVRDEGCKVGDGTGIRSASEANRASTLASNPGAVSVVVDIIDGHDNDCNGQIPVVELDCDDDGSFPLLPVNPPPATFRGAGDLGLASCVADATAPVFSCWDQRLEIACDNVTGLWVTRYGTSTDGFGGRYAGGYRVLSGAQGCSLLGDCDDHCPTRCPSQPEACDGVDNDCTLVGADGPSSPSSLPQSLSDAAPAGTVVLAELDFDGDGHASCEESFLDGDTPVHEAPRTCTPFGEETQLADCDDLCFYENLDATEVCDGFVNVCDAAVSEREGSDRDGDRFVDCGAYGPADSLVDEEVFVPVWVDCAESSVAGTALATACSRAVAAADGSVRDVPRLIPLISPRPLAPACDAPLRDALLTLAARAGIPDAATWLSTADATTLVQALCAPGTPTGGICSSVQITLLRDEEVIDDGNGGALDPECEAAPEQATVRTVWSSDRVLEARRAIVEGECLRMFGLPCDQIQASTPRVLLGVPPIVDAQLEEKIIDGDTDDSGNAPWWLELRRFAAHTTSGAIMTCWGDPRVEAVSARTGGDCDDTTSSANRDLPEGPNDLVLAYLGQNGDCARCVDGIDNNCDGLADCADPTCAVCFVGQGQGCAGAKDACGDGAATGGGCTSGPEGRNLALLAMLPLLGLVARRRARRTRA